MKVKIQTMLNGLACPPCRTDLLADDAVFVFGRVEDNGLKLAEVNVTLFVEDALVSTHVDNLANHTGTTVLVFIEAKVTTLHSSVSLYSLIIGASTLGLGVIVNPALAILSGTSLPDTMPK